MLSLPIGLLLLTRERRSLLECGKSNDDASFLLIVGVEEEEEGLFYGEYDRGKMVYTVLINFCLFVCLINLCI
jgi:hypothetical protein